MFGFSLLTVVFEDGIDNYFARTRVLERLELSAEPHAGRCCPAAWARCHRSWDGSINIISRSIQPPRPNGGYDLGTLRSLQDFFIRYQLASVEGVAEVAERGRICAAVLRWRLIPERCGRPG